MRKLVAKNFFAGMIVMLSSAIVAGGVIALISLLVELFTVLVYILGGIIGIATCFTLQKLFFTQKQYFLPAEITKDKKNHWIERIIEDEPIKQTKIYATYIPLFVLCLILMIFAVIFEIALKNAVINKSYIFYAAICAMISASIFSLAGYIYIEMRSYTVCKECRAVNSFIFDEKLENVKATSFSQYYTTGRTYVIRHKGEKYGDRIDCHCAYCGKKAIVTEIYDNTRWPS